jgi:hypothetical protein
MARLNDDEDWVGTPPEGRHSRDRARPDFWSRQWRLAVPGAVIALVLAILLVVALVR